MPVAAGTAREEASSEPGLEGIGRGGKISSILGALPTSGYIEGQYYLDPVVNCSPSEHRPSNASHSIGFVVNACRKLDVAFSGRLPLSADIPD